MEIARRRIDYSEGVSSRPASVLPNLILLAMMISTLGAALAGALGGGKPSERTADSPDAFLAIAAPRVLRTGEFFEFRVLIGAKEKIAAPTLVFGAGAIRDATINSFMPAPDSESSDADEFEFRFASLDRGEQLSVKIDGQINETMIGDLEGPVSIRDGRRELAQVDLEIGVLP